MCVQYTLPDRYESHTARIFGIIISPTGGLILAECGTQAIIEMLYLSVYYKYIQFNLTLCSFVCKRICNKWNIYLIKNKKFPFFHADYAFVRVQSTVKVGWVWCCMREKAFICWKHTYKHKRLYANYKWLLSASFNSIAEACYYYVCSSAPHWMHFQIVGCPLNFLSSSWANLNFLFNYS